MKNTIKEEKIEVGNDILSHCGKCKEDTYHIISVMAGDKISKVMCKTCKAQHNYRKPKMLDKDKTETKPVKTAKTAKTTSARKGLKSAAKKWNDILANYELNDAQGYKMKQNYEESAIIDHPAFGIGVVTRKIDQNKIEIHFETGIKLLAINRK